MADEHEKVKELLDQRDQAVKDCTQQILREIKHVTDAVELHLQLDQSANETQLIWENAILSEEAYQEHGGILILIATLYYGQTVNILRFGVPLDMVDQTKDDVVQFLEENAKKEEDLNPEEAEALEHMMQQAARPIPVEGPEPEPIEDNDAKGKWGQTFDTDELTPEQREQLRLYNLTANNKNKRSN